VTSVSAVYLELTLEPCLPRLSQLWYSPAESTTKDLSQLYPFLYNTSIRQNYSLYGKLSFQSLCS